MSPEEDRTRDAVDSEPKHYQLSYSGPHWRGPKIQSPQYPTAVCIRANTDSGSKKLSEELHSGFIVSQWLLFYTCSLVQPPQSNQGLMQLFGI